MSSSSSGLSNSQTVQGGKSGTTGKWFWGKNRKLWFLNEKVHFYCSPDLYKRAIENSCKIGVRHHCTIAGGKCAVIKFHHMLRVVEILWHHNSQTIWFGWQRIKGRPADWVETDWLQYVVDSQWWVVVLDRFVLGCCGVVCGVWCVVCGLVLWLWCWTDLWSSLEVRQRQRQRGAVQ